jgi:hydroxypyruvate reductase
MAREHLEAIWRAGVDACLPERVLGPHVPRPPKGQTYVLALGKGAVAMARVVEEAWEGPLNGLAVAPHGTGGALKRLELVTAAHPVPDAASVAAAERMLALAGQAGANDLVLVLLSGGASALACLPGEGLSLDQKRQITGQLLRSGAAIGEINMVRRHLSRFKGGRLGLAAAPARLVTLAISDVVGDRPEDIGSGPTVADPTDMEAAKAMLARRGIEAPTQGWSESAKAVTGEYHIVASGRAAMEAAAVEARRLGYAPVLMETEGEAREAGRDHARLARSSRPGTALICGGELTVTVRGQGEGGPNQEYALAAALELGGTQVIGLAADTDGIDGNGEAAGAFFDGDVPPDGEAALASNDSGGFFRRAGRLFITGSTGTNVNDLRIMLVRP